MPQSTLTPSQFIGYDLVPVVMLAYCTPVPHPTVEAARRMSDRVLWCLYGVIHENCAYRIGDFKTYEMAAAIYSRITGCLAPANPAGHRLLRLPAIS